MTVVARLVMSPGLATMRLSQKPWYYELLKERNERGEPYRWMKIRSGEEVDRNVSRADRSRAEIVGSEEGSE